MIDPSAEYAIVGALTDDGVYGLAPGYQVGPFIDALARRGWVVVRKEEDYPPESGILHSLHGGGQYPDTCVFCRREANPPPSQIQADPDWRDNETRAGET